MAQQSTQLFAHCHGLDSETGKKVAELMEEQGLPVTSTEGSSGEEYIQMTNGFPDTDEYETKVESLYEQFQTDFDELTVEKHIGEGPGYQHLPFDWIYEITIRNEESYEELKQERRQRAGDYRISWEKSQQQPEGVGEPEGTSDYLLGNDSVESPSEEDPE